MQLRELNFRLLLLLALSGPTLLHALESDRQQQLLVNADSTEGTLGDGKAILRGNVEIRQGSLLVKADIAEVENADGRVRLVLLTGKPVLLQQEIENEGLVTATASTISYQVVTGMVTLSGNADVNHPQYQISGEVLTYDMNLQRFQGSGGDNNGRIRIELAPEVIPQIKTKPDPAPAQDASDGTAPPAAPESSSDTPEPEDAAG
jgi:lipopolysaccharide export system protein LptA